jgi:hypothetical protein
MRVLRPFGGASTARPGDWRLAALPGRRCAKTHKLDATNPGQSSRSTNLLSPPARCKFWALFGLFCPGQANDFRADIFLHSQHCIFGFIRRNACAGDSQTRQQTVAIARM